MKQSPSLRGKQSVLNLNSTALIIDPELNTIQKIFNYEKNSEEIFKPADEKSISKDITMEDATLGTVNEMKEKNHASERHQSHADTGNPFKKNGLRK